MKQPPLHYMDHESTMSNHLTNENENRESVRTIRYCVLGYRIFVRSERCKKQNKSEDDNHVKPIILSQWLKI